MTPISPAPKPKRAPPKKRRFIPRQSLKQLSRHPKAQSTIVRKSSRKIGRNQERQAREYARCFHSSARVKFVKSLACFATGQYATEADPIDNAHVTDDGSKGASRRSGYACIAPLKRSAHRLLHRDAEKFAAKYGAFDWIAAAAWTEAEWQKVSGAPVRGTGVEEWEGES